MFSQSESDSASLNHRLSIVYFLQMSSSVSMHLMLLINHIVVYPGY